MDNQVDLRRKVFNREQFFKTVNTEFSTFIKPVSTLPLTIEEFFSFYDQLYLSIPIQGAVNSHEYLVKKSSELYNFEGDTSLIEPLLDEIAKLREQLLSANRQIVELQTQLINNSINPVISEEPDLDIPISTPAPVASTPAPVASTPAPTATTAPTPTPTSGGPGRSDLFFNEE